jgi:digeranylgeranylglycerophospholipid reductase
LLISQDSSIECDIAIVGGGLAGLSAALTIATESDARVILIDRVIGSNRSLPLTFLDTIRQFGLEDSILARYHSFAMHTRTGKQALRRFASAPLVALDYGAACRQLYSRLETSVDFTHLPTQAKRLEHNPGQWRIGLRDGSDVACPLVIDASGAAHFTARQLGHPTTSRYSHSYGKILAGCHVPMDQKDVAFFLTGNPRHGNGGGWFYPLKARRVSFGFAQLTNSSRFPRRECRLGFERALHEFYPYAEVVQGASPEDVHVGSIPIGPVKRLVYDGLMLVGDAAGQATPWACMGAEPALLNGQLCGHVAASARRERDFGRSRLRGYETAWKARNGDGYRKAVMLANLEWQRGEEAWDHTVHSLDRMSGSEMLDSLRYNTPHFPLPLIWWLLVYDRLGLIRRGVRDRLQL